MQKTLLYLFIGSCYFLTCCSGENNDGAGTTDETNQDEMLVDSNSNDSVQIEIPLAEGEIYSEDFHNLFQFSFEHYYDFGWRYIESNYEEYPEDIEREVNDYDTKNNLADITTIKVRNEEGEIESYPIGFEGYANSKKYINGNYMFVTYIKKEIGEEFHYYYVDTKNGYTIIDEGTLAENGGDEGSWYYSHGEFSKDNSVYQITYADGEGLDTADHGTELIYFE